MSVLGDKQSTTVDSTSDHEVEKVEFQQTEKVLDDAHLLNEAFEGENKEHEMGAWEAAKKHPWACLWAFTMCFTIVSDGLSLSGCFMGFPRICPQRQIYSPRMITRIARIYICCSPFASLSYKVDHD